MNPPRQVSETRVEKLSLDEAMAERATLVMECTDIQTQLGNRNRLDAEGKRVPDKDYWDWRNRASFALAARTKRMTLLKERIRKARTEANLAVAGLSDTSDKGLLRSVYQLLRKLAREGVDYDPAEQALLDVIRERTAG